MLQMKWRGAEIQPRTLDSLIAIYEELFQFLFKRTDCPGFSNGDWNSIVLCGKADKRC